MHNGIFIRDIHEEGEALFQRMTEFENRLHAFSVNAILDADQGQDMKKEELWNASRCVTKNLTDSRASLKIAVHICDKLQEMAINVGAWE